MALKETFKIKYLFHENRVNELDKISAYPSFWPIHEFKLDNAEDFSWYLHHRTSINKAIVSLNSLLNLLPRLMELSKRKDYIPVDYGLPPLHSFDPTKERLTWIIQHILSCDDKIRDFIFKANRISDIIGESSLADERIISNYQSNRNALLPGVNNFIINKKRQDVLKTTKKEKLVMLVIDNNPDTLQVMASHFQLDFEIHTANNRLSGLKKALDITPNIILIDEIMSEFNVSICQTLRSNAITSHTPIILLSSNTASTSIIEGLGNGADDYITKPFNLNVLEMRIWNLLDSRHKLRERYRKEIHLQPQNITITSYDEKFMKKVMSFIETNISDSSLNVEELSKEIGMSRVTLYRKIKTLTGQTAIGFIRNVRIKRAAQLLEQNNLKINEVAYMVGFLDIDYFRRCFKEHFGHTPSDYINSRSAHI
jgi:AraC-like DNA-binding protein